MPSRFHLPLFCLLAALGAQVTAAGAPNVLFITVDDLRPALGCYGDPLAKTPHIDRFAATARRFDRAYCQQAVCGPSRASLLTGLLPDHTRVWHNRHHFRRMLPDHVTLPQLFKNHGWQTLALGKIFSGDEREDDPAGASTTYAYDAQHRLTSVTDPLNRVTTYTYNSKHQPLTVTNALNETTTHAYDNATGYLLSTTNHAGHGTSFEYDAYGQLKKTILPGGAVLEQHVNARGLLEWSKDARGILTTYTHNLSGQALTATSGGRVAQTEYDGNRQPWRVTNPRGFATTTTYSATGKPESVTAPDSAVMTAAYNTRDLPAAVTGPLGETIQTTYDAVERPVTVTDPLTRAITNAYDADGVAISAAASAPPPTLMAAPALKPPTLTDGLSPSPEPPPIP